MKKYFGGNITIYRELLNDKINKIEIGLDRKSELCEFLASCSQEDKQYLFFSGAFDDFMLTHLEYVLEVGLIDPRTAEEVCDVWREVVDTKNI